MVVVLVWPSKLEAVTAYVKFPASDVSSTPGLDEPAPSVQL
jgi:hypothetical protein